MTDDPNPPAILRPAADLRTLAAEINAAHQSGEESTRRGLAHFRAAGEALLKAKKAVGHGGFKAWVETHVHFSYRTAAGYMRVAREWEKCATVAHLGDALRMLTEDAHDGDETAPTPTPATSAPPESGGGPADAGGPEADEPDDESEAAPSRDRGAEEAAIVDAEGQPVPERLRPLFALVPPFEQAVRLAERAASAFQDIEQTAPYRRAVEGTKHPDYSTYFRSGARAIKSMTPGRLCPQCGGEFEPSMDNDPCPACLDRGYLTAEEAAS
jgi:hypothetical protein